MCFILPSCNWPTVTFPLRIPEVTGLLSASSLLRPGSISARRLAPLDGKMLSIIRTPSGAFSRPSAMRCSIALASSVLPWPLAYSAAALALERFVTCAADKAAPPRNPPAGPAMALPIIAPALGVNVLSSRRLLAKAIGSTLIAFSSSIVNEL